MDWHLVSWIALGIAALLFVAGAAWLWSLPLAPARSPAQPVDDEESDATTQALKLPKRERPLIAVIGMNDATETLDYVMPYGILRRADVADVVALATEPGPVRLFPALTVQPQRTIAAFDAEHPDGADFVLVPAMSRDDDPAVMTWLKSQAAKGATVIGVCAGAKIVAAAGLLDGKRATTHWYSVGELRRKHPAIRYVADRRFVVDGRVATTTGISASMPMSLTLIEAIAGRVKAETVAHELGLANWDARHDSSAFRFTRPFALTVMANTLAFWNRERFGIELSSEVDGVSLALVADAWSRTYRSRAVTFAAHAGGIETRDGIRILPDEVTTTWPVSRLLRVAGDGRPVAALDEALGAIAARHGTRTADVVAMQLEYSRQGTSR